MLLLRGSSLRSSNIKNKRQRSVCNLVMLGLSVCLSDFKTPNPQFLFLATFQ